MTYDQVLDHFGSQRAVQEALNVSAPALGYWRKVGVPRGVQFELQVMTGGKLQADPDAGRTRWQRDTA